MGSFVGVDTGHSLAGALAIGINCKMLCSGGNLIVALQTLHHLYAEFGNQIWVLAIYFLVTAPTLVAAHIEDRCINIGITQKHAFPAGDIAHLSDEFAVPGMAKTELSREIGGFIRFYAADSFIGKIDGNSETGFFYEPFLHLIQGLGVS